MAERLGLDVSRTYESGVLGKRGDDKFPIQAGRIVRVEFHKEVKSIPIKTGLFSVPGMGRGDAYTNDTDLPDVGVHYWLDAGTKLVYHLKVWIDD